MMFRRAAATDSEDPYKLVVLNLLSRGDPQSAHAAVLRTTEDYLWLKVGAATGPRATAAAGCA